jgi:D-cysteine desulfhydrase
MSKFQMPDKLKLAQLPTPIQYLPNFSKIASKFGKVNLYVKRDDVTHGPAAGNKIRKLEFLLYEAVSKGAKVVFTCGGLQSNHARATAILCKQLGLECVLFLRGEPPTGPLEGNLLLDRMLGVRIEYVTQEEYNDIKTPFFKVAEFYRKRDGKAPFLIPEGGTGDIGTMGYCSAFQEIRSQAGTEQLPSKFSSIVVANGSGGTHAGLLLGRNLSDWDEGCEIVSFNVCRTAQEMTDRVKLAIIGAIQRYRIPISFMPADIHVIDGYVGPGYALATREHHDLILEVAQKEGLFLDPVYTAKAFLGLMTELAASPERAKLFGENILFVHTGGFPSLFAHFGEMK